MPKYSKEILEKICQYIIDGNNYEDSAILSGICEKTLYNWKNGKGLSEQDHVQFLQSLKVAEAKSKAEDILTIKKAGRDGNWQASMTRLERKYKTEYGKLDKVDHSGTLEVRITREIIGDDIAESKSED